MAELFEASLAALQHLTTFDAIAMVFLGALIGIVFGALPGLSSIAAMVLVLPFTFGMDASNAMYLYAGIIGSSSMGGSIPAIILNTPGTATNVPTCFDGYPMARRGEAARALSISACSAATGTLIGALTLFLLIPVVRPIILSFGAPEMFLLIIGGLICIAFVVSGNVIKGVAMGGVGILLALVGANAATGIHSRFAFSTTYGFEGLQIIPVFVGVFALGELLHYTAKGGRIAEPEAGIGVIESWGHQIRQGARDVLGHPVNVGRSGLIGTLVGIIPGIGGGTAAFLSYSVAKQLSKVPDTFGRGNPEGLIAAETANDAKDGGALLPTVALGVPGSADQAILLAAFILHGLTPGPLLLINSLNLVMALLFGLIVGQLITSVFGLLAAPYIARMTTINIHYLAPFIAVLCLIGPYALRRNVWDIFVVLAFGAFGYLLKRYQFPLVTLAIGFVLGALAEQAFFRSLDIGRGSIMFIFSRPVAVAIMMVLGALIILPKLVGIWKGR